MNKRQLLKNIIKEALSEVLRDELRVILREELANNKPIIQNIIPQISGNNKENTNINPGIRKKVNFNEFLPGFKQRPTQTPQSKNAVLNEALKKNPLAAFIQDTAKNLSADEMQKLSQGIGAIEEPVMSMSQPSMVDYGEMDNYSPPNMPNFDR